MLVSTLFTVLAAGVATAVPLNRRDVALDASATAEAQKFDATATRAFTATTITTSDGKCLSVDPFSGDFRENLTPVNVVACDGSKNQTWDVITSGVHNNVKGQALIVSSLTNACLNFDSRRAPGNQVLLFSCGGRADGSGQVTDSQLFAFNGSAGPQALVPQAGKNAVCLTVKNNLVDQTACNGAASATGAELFTFGGQAAATTSSASALALAATSSAEDCALPVTVTKTVTIDSAATQASSSGNGGNAGSSSNNAGSSSSSSSNTGSSSKSSSSSSNNAGSSSSSSSNTGSSSKSSSSSSNAGSSSSSSSSNNAGSSSKSSSSSGNAGSSSKGSSNTGSNSKSSGSSSNTGSNSKSSSSSSTGSSASSSNAGSSNKGSSGKGSSTDTSSAAAASSTVLAVTPPPATAEDPQALQSSLTISQSVIQTTDDGQNPAVAGQTAAATSPNNFANLCATTLNTIPLTNGLQITTGSCNPIPIGYIPSVDNMVASKFQFPPNAGTIASDQTFTIVLKTVGMQIGAFSNAQKTYFGNPQTLNAKGQIIGHTHVVIESIPDITTTEITNSQNFVFFKGVNDPNDANNEVQVPVTGGLKPGAYRMCTIVSSLTHQPVIMPVAQHGSTDDCIYFNTAAGGAAAAGTGAAAGAGAAATDVAASSAAPAAAASSSPAPALAAAVASSVAADTTVDLRGGSKTAVAAAAASSVAASSSPAPALAAAVASSVAASATVDLKASSAAASASVAASSADAAKSTAVAQGQKSQQDQKNQQDQKAQQDQKGHK